MDFRPETNYPSDLPGNGNKILMDLFLDFCQKNIPEIQF